MTRLSRIPALLFVSIFLAVCGNVFAHGNDFDGAQAIRGSVQSNGRGLPGYKVTILASYSGEPSQVKIVGHARTDRRGYFKIWYKLGKHNPHWLQPILFVRAEKGESMLMATAGPPSYRSTVVVNELTTVATGYAFAQFVHGRTIFGNRYGMLNAVKMADNLVDSSNGKEAMVLRRSPNGSETSTEQTFYSISNIVAQCVRSHSGCKKLFDETTLPGGKRPRTVIQAVANMAKYPWLNVSGLFDLSFVDQVYGPALSASEQPDAWTLFLKFTGSFSSEQNTHNLMNGPGNFAINEQGYLWVLNNYVAQPPNVAACAGEFLLKFYPWGENFYDSPYYGGGLSGAGFGITIGPDDLIWVGNFGFAGKGCDPAPSNSLSVLLPDGQPISTPGGIQAGDMYWPQGMASDDNGSIWVANCGNDSVTFYPEGDFGNAVNLAPPYAGTIKPFDVGLDHEGNAWVTGSYNSSLTVYDRDGNLIEAKESDGYLARPMAVAADSKGNMWVSNSDWMDMACPQLPNPDLGPGTNPSVMVYQSSPSREPYPTGPFSGGGLTLPWGIALDGNDTVWVANFGFPFDTGNPEATPPWTELNRVTHYCGMDTSKCPPGKQQVGAAISPDVSGYTSDALKRNTGIAIDPSGNVWLTNNWKEIPEQTNPGENSIAVMIGVAAPVKTPLRGPVQSFND